MYNKIMFIFVTALLGLYLFLVVLAFTANAHETKFWKHQHGTRTWKGAAYCDMDNRMWRSVDDDLWYPIRFIHGWVHIGEPQETSDCQTLYRRLEEE